MFSDIVINSKEDLDKFVTNPISDTQGEKLVFINGDLLDETLLISKLRSLNLIIHDSDRHIVYSDQNWIHNQKLVFSTNNNLQGLNSYLLPLGIENLNHFVNGIPLEFHLLRMIAPRRKIFKITYSFNTITNPPLRQNALDVVKQISLAQFISVRGHKFRYNLSRHAYSLCPEGNCIDTHRLWESLYLRTIPIVTYTPIYKSYYKIGIPILILNNWEDLYHLDLSFLIEFYSLHKDWFQNKPLYFDYWRDFINHKITQNS